MAGGDQTVLELQVVLDNAVVRNVKAAGAITVWMRIGFAWPAVRRPPRVTNSTLHGSVSRIHFADLFFELAYPADGSNDARCAAIHDSDATGVIAAILQALEAINQYA